MYKYLKFIKSRNFNNEDFDVIFNSDICTKAWKKLKKIEKKKK